MVKTNYGRFSRLRCVRDVFHTANISVKINEKKLYKKDDFDKKKKKKFGNISTERRRRVSSSRQRFTV